MEVPVKTEAPVPLFIPSDDVVITSVESNGGQYQCKVCNKGFARRDHLDRHMRVHTGEKPFKCDICYKSFTDSSYLNRHTTTHT